MTVHFKEILVDISTGFTLIASRSASIILGFKSLRIVLQRHMFFFFSLLLVSTTVCHFQVKYSQRLTGSVKILVIRVDLM